MFLSVATVRAEVAGEKLMIGSFSTGSLDHWESREFKGQTKYLLVDLAGTRVLKAESTNSASGLFKEQRIDLQKTPVMNWRWRIENRLGNINEQDKSGDDYATRVYVVVSGGVAFWRTRAINYVWASTSPAGKIWPNAFAGNHAMMVALRSSSDQSGVWYTEKRNILADLKQQFGEDILYIDAVAIMTDTDNAHGKVTAYYGDIYFSKN
jgi:predicted secreted protein